MLYNLNNIILMNMIWKIISGNYNFYIIIWLKRIRTLLKLSFLSVSVILDSRLTLWIRPKYLCKIFTLKSSKIFFFQKIRQKTVQKPFILYLIHRCMCIEIRMLEIIYNKNSITITFSIQNRYISWIPRILLI